MPAKAGIQKGLIFWIPDRGGMTWAYLDSRLRGNDICIGRACEGRHPETLDILESRLCRVDFTHRE